MSDSLISWLRHVTTGAQKDKSHEKEDRVAKGGDPPTYKRTTTQNIEVLVVWNGLEASYLYPFRIYPWILLDFILLFV